MVLPSGRESGPFKCELLARITSALTPGLATLNIGTGPPRLGLATAGAAVAAASAAVSEGGCICNIRQQHVSDPHMREETPTLHPSSSASAIYAAQYIQSHIIATPSLLTVIT